MIEIVQAELLHTDEDRQFWSCWLQITLGAESWMLPTTAPGTLDREELQAHFEAREDKLWRVAQEKQYIPDILQHISREQLLRASVLATLDEFNVLRQEQGMRDLAEEEFITTIKAKLKLL